VDTPGKFIEYRPNALGQRVAKLIDGEVVERYLWQDLTTLLAVYDGQNNLKQRFEYTVGHTPTSFTQGGQRYYIQTDHLGSPRVITDSSGSVVKAIRYDSYGNITDDSNPEFEIPFGFAGGLHDMDAGLIRFGYRDYDPEAGRWTARDPIGFDGGDSNLYGYVLGDPVNAVDLLGLEGRSVFSLRSGIESSGGQMNRSEYAPGNRGSSALESSLNILVGTSVFTFTNEGLKTGQTTGIGIGVYVESCAGAGSAPMCGKPDAAPDSFSTSKQGVGISTSTDLSGGCVTIGPVISLPGITWNTTGVH